MKSLKTERAVEVLGEIGYDAIELAARPGWDADPKNCSTNRRKNLRRSLTKNGLQLTAMMEHLQPSTDRAAKSRIHIFRGGNDK